MVPEPSGQGECVAGQRPVPGSVVGDAFRGRAAVVVTDPGQRLVVQGVVPGGAGGGGAVVGVGEGGGHRLRPELTLGLSGVKRA